MAKSIRKDGSYYDANIDRMVFPTHKEGLSLIRWKEKNKDVLAIASFRITCGFCESTSIVLKGSGKFVDISCDKCGNKFQYGTDLPTV